MITKEEKQVSVRLNQPHFVHGEVREAGTVVVLPVSIAHMFGEVEKASGKNATEEPKAENATGKKK